MLFVRVGVQWLDGVFPLLGWGVASVGSYQSL